MRLTEEQGRAVRAPGSVAVVAGAGCGKTSLLAERYVHHLTEDGLSPLGVVAVTFTEKAAEELRSRIRRRVQDAVPDAEEVSAELEAAQISTIHALCARICREHPEEAGVPPDFSILDDVFGGVWSADRLLDALDTLPPEHYRYLPYPLMHDTLAALLADPIAAGRALQRASEDGLEGWRAMAGEARARATRDFLEDPEVGDCSDTLRACEGAEGDLMEANRAVAVAALDALSAGEGGETGAPFGEIKGIKLNGGRKANWPEGELPAVKDALKRLRARVEDELKRGMVALEVGPADERLAEVLPVLTDSFGRAAEFLSEEKRRARVLDFSDLELHALQALQSEEVRDYYRERWRVFLVDEFQDTNPAQAEILEHLTPGTRLTIVGDEKQSIYGFRRADVGVFRRFRERILGEPGGGEEVLAITFRCHGQLIAKLNEAFAPILGDLHQELAAHRAEPPHDAPHIRAYAIEPEEKVRKAALERAEAAHIARLIGEMVGGGRLVGEGSGTRPATPGDFAILSRTWAVLDGCGEALSAAGIPSVHAGGGDLLGTREAKDGLALLRFLADPGDELALVAVLRSPFFAVDDPTLHAVALSRPRGASWWRAVEEYDGEASEGLSAAREVLGELLGRRRVEPPSELLALADRLTGYTAVVSNLPGPERRLADWRGFVELARGLERGHEDAFTVVRSLRRMGEAGVGVPRPLLAAGDAVSLMTIHSAKGLEWPVVIVPDLSRAPRSSAPAVLFDPEVGVGVDFGDEVDAEDGKPVLYKLVSDRLRLARRAEDKRLFYVALTRTRDHLILTTTDGQARGDSGLTLLRPGLEAAGVEVEPVPFRPEDALAPEPSAVDPGGPAPLLI